MFKAESYTPEKKDLYGYSTDITRPTLDNWKASATCLEYRCSDVMNNGSLNNNTFIVIRPVSDGCQLVKLGHDLNFYQNQCPYSMPPQQGVVYSLCDVPMSSFKYPSPGLYNTQFFPWQTTESSCRDGYLGLGVTSSGIYSKGYALHYDCI